MARCELVLPPHYDQLRTAEDFALHEQLAARSVQDFAEGMVDVRTMELANGQGIEFVDKRHPEEVDTKTAVLKFRSFNNGYGLPEAITHEVDQGLATEKRRILLIPNNGYEFTEAEKKNPLESVALKGLEVAVKLGIEKVQLDGYSQGALVAAAALEQARDGGDLDVLGAFFGDPVVKTGRTEEALKADFLGGHIGLDGLRDFFKAVNQTGIPAFSRIQNAGFRPDKLARFAKGGMAFGKQAKSETNTLLHQAMATADFVGYLERAYEADEPMPDSVRVLRMFASLICTTELDDQLDIADMSKAKMIMHGYGHGGGDNLFALGLAKRVAFEGAPSDEWNQLVAA